jgi:hypothetical protein
VPGLSVESHPALAFFITPNKAKSTMVQFEDYHVGQNLDGAIFGGQLDGSPSTLDASSGEEEGKKG